MTEEEAKTKWCPYARVQMGGSASAQLSSGHNRQAAYVNWAADNTPPGTRCIASACMAWRETYVIANVDMSNYQWGSPVPMKTVGYCGLAGKP